MRALAVALLMSAQTTHVSAYFSVADTSYSALTLGPSHALVITDTYGLIVTFDENLKPHYAPGATCEDAWDVVDRITLDENTPEVTRHVVWLISVRQEFCIPPRCELRLWELARWAEHFYGNEARSP